MSNLLGRRIRNFRVVDLLGKGGMGEVYVGYDETLERKVALKTIKAERRLDETAKARFLREARVLSQLHHPNICQIHDYISGDDADVLVLELISGKSLKHVGKDLSFKQKLDVAMQLTQVLIAAHEKGIVHRDLKPDNVMITEEGQVKVLDFGLSRSKVDEDTLVMISQDADTLVKGVPEMGDEDTTSVSLAPSSDLTTDGMVMGTLGYMSPEQARGETATPASDIYSFGLMLQELFTGKPPYEKGGSAHDLLLRTAEGKTVPVEGIDSDVTALINRMKLLAVAARPTAVDVEERFLWIVNKPTRRAKKNLTIATIMVLIIFSLLMSIQTLRATRAESEAKAAAEQARLAEATAKAAKNMAQSEAESARSVTSFMTGLFELASPLNYFLRNAGPRDVVRIPQDVFRETVTIEQLLGAGVERANKELIDQPKIRAAVLDSIGRAYSYIKDDIAAEDLLREALSIRERILPPNHPDTVESLLHIGTFLWVRDRFDEAEPFLDRHLEFQESSVGVDSPDLVPDLYRMADFLTDRARYEDAEALYNRCVEIRSKRFGRISLGVAHSTQKLARLSAIQGRETEADTLYRESVRIAEQALGKDHGAVAQMVLDYASYLLSRDRLREAEVQYKQAIEVGETASEEEVGQGDGRGILVGSAYYDLAHIYARQSKIREAVESLDSAVEWGAVNWVIESGTFDGSDLESLQSNPEFETLVARVRATAKAKTESTAAKKDVP